MWLTIEDGIILTRECIVFQDNLMDDTTTRFPESNSIFSSRCSQKIINFFVNVLCPGKIFISLNLSLNQVVTVDSRWDSYLKK